MLLLTFGWFYAAASPVALLVGLQMGNQLLSVSFPMFVLGYATIHIANSNFTPTVRIATIGWGVFLVGLFAGCIALASVMSYEGVVVFFVLEVVFAIPIPIQAILRTPQETFDQHEI